MHPMLNENVSLYYEEADTTRYFVENAEGKRMMVGPMLYKALLNADGTHPLELPDQGRQVLPVLKEYGVVRTSRFVQFQGIHNGFTLIPIKNGESKHRRLYQRLNAALPVVSILMFVLGICLALCHFDMDSDNVNCWLFCAMVLASVLLHECGHLLAGMACGCQCSELGILLLGFLPVGAYVAINEDKEVGKRGKVQMYLAGIEMNLLIAGVCLILASFNTDLSFTMLMCAGVNIQLAVINLLPAAGMDGEQALSTLCGVDNIGAWARKCLFNKKLRHRLLHCGRKGYMCLSILVLILIPQLFLCAITLGPIAVGIMILCNGGFWIL